MLCYVRLSRCVFAGIVAPPLFEPPSILEVVLAAFLLPSVPFFHLHSGPLEEAESVDTLEERG